MQISRIIHTIVLLVLIILTTGQAQWIKTSAPNNRNIVALVVSDSILYAGMPGTDGVYRSSNNGDSWKNIANGLSDTSVTSLAVNGEFLFAGTMGGGIFRTNSNAGTWTKVNNGITDTDIRALIIVGTYIFAGTQASGIFRSINNGDSWTQVSSGLTIHTVISFGESGKYLFAGTYPSGLFRSTSNGDSWSLVDVGVVGNGVTALKPLGDNFYASSYSGGVFKTNTFGEIWDQVNTGLINPYVTSIASYGEILFAGTDGSGVYQSKDSGNLWNDANTTGTVFMQTLSLAANEKNLFAGTRGQGIWRRPLSELNAVKVLPRNRIEGVAFNKNQNTIAIPDDGIEIALANQSRVNLSLYDVHGKKEITILDEALNSGIQYVHCDCREISSGIHFLRLEANGKNLSKIILLEK